MKRPAVVLIVAAIIAGIAGLILAVTAVSANANGGSVECGSYFSASSSAGDSAAATHARQVAEALGDDVGGEAMDTGREDAASYAAACDDARSSRGTPVWILFGAAALLAIAGAVLAAYRRE